MKNIFSSVKNLVNINLLKPETFYDITKSCKYITETKRIYKIPLVNHCVLNTKSFT